MQSVVNLNAVLYCIYPFTHSLAQKRSRLQYWYCLKLTSRSAL